MHQEAPDGATQVVTTLAGKPPLLTVRETAWCLGLSPASVWRLLAQGRLRAHRLGRATRVNRTSVEALIAALAGGEDLVIRGRAAAHRAAATTPQSADGQGA